MLRIGVALFILAAAGPASAADAAFQQFLQSLWPQARERGVSRPTFDAATRGLEPDLSLPDLVIPGRAEAPQREQAEFVQTPADYLKESTLARLAAQGRKLADQHRTTLATIERRFGVPGPVVLAIFGRETDFGNYKLAHNAVRVLATQSYLGRRKEQFRGEFLLALKMLQDGHVKLADMRSSWAGAMGLVQLLPSDFYNYAVDFDGDGRRDIWSSVPDALASAAKQLAGKGWQRGKRWAYEVRVPKSVDCTMAEPGIVVPIGEWLKRGVAPVDGRHFSEAERAEPASLLMPEGLYGPAFLTPKNYFVLKEYNVSDLYVLFVGSLSDRILGGGPFKTKWSKTAQLKTVEVEEMQRILTSRRLYAEKIDGKAGMKTRAALGAYQKNNGLLLDCWPNRAALDHMRGSEKK
jgi:lytic murein transglycosylase